METQPRDRGADGLVAVEDGVVSIGMQPRPTVALVATARIGPITFTAIARGWREGDVRHCRLCPRCMAAGSVCLVITPRAVADESVALFSIRR